MKTKKLNHRQGFIQGKAKGGDCPPPGYFVPPLEVVGVKNTKLFPRLWLTGYINYFLLALRNVEIAEIAPSYAIF